MLNFDDIAHLLSLARGATIQASTAPQVAALFERTEAALNEMAYTQMALKKEAARPKTPPVDPITS